MHVLNIFTLSRFPVAHLDETSHMYYTRYCYSEVLVKPGS